MRIERWSERKRTQNFESETIQSIAMDMMDKIFANDSIVESTVHIGNIFDCEFEGDRVELLEDDDRKSNRLIRGFTDCFSGMAGNFYVIMCVDMHLAVLFLILLLVWNKGFINI